MSKPMQVRRARRSVGSMRWAAWADALGFISELTSEAGLRRRLEGRPLTDPVDWTRRIGGKFGVDVRLPAGCYSDDTQLRLAVARAVHSRGFDIEAFARVELTVWPSYALGGGRASKAAAANLAKPETPWFGNFYKGYLDAGGNGAAMRVQPHVWAAQQPTAAGQHLLDVLVDGVTTHGHPRALVGAVLHALVLGTVLQDGTVPSVQSWPDLLDATEQAVKLIDEHPQLSSLWRPAWEARTGGPLADGWRAAVEECREMLPAATLAADRIASAACQGPEARAAYRDLVAVLSLDDPDKRGQATSTVVAAMALAAAAPCDPAEAARLAASMVPTDTDTIATMAGAIIGAADGAPEPPAVLDGPYLTAEAVRLAEIAGGQPTVPFSYPDLLGWVPPRSQVDVVGLAGRMPAMAGLGWLEQIEGTDPVRAQSTEWLWATSDFGATFLVKRRPKMRDLPPGNWPVRRDRQPVRPDRAAGGSKPAQQLPLVEDRDMTSTARDGEDARMVSPVPPAGPGAGPRDFATGRDPVNIDDMLDWLARNGYADGQLGYATRRIAELGTVEQMVAFTTALRTAIRKARR